MRRRATRILGALALALVSLSSEAQEASSARLDAIREHLVQAHFEKALKEIEALLGEPSLSPAERGQALEMRAQAHVSLGALDAAERDYREILKLEPGYEPQPSLTPQKALQRFAAVRAQMVGRMKLTVEPKTARVTVDGVVVVADPDGIVPALAGDRALRVELAGHDPDDRVVAVEANKETAVEIRLSPNARSVVLRTEPEGVVVRVDGREAGTTARDANGTAELVLENLPLGEHVFELSRPCFATQTVRDVLTVDLLDREPKRYETVRLVPSRGRLTLRGGPPAAEVRIDDAVAGRLPASTLEACPGDHTLEIRTGGRILWRGPVALAEGGDAVVDVAPRPNLVFLGAEGADEGAATFLAAYTILERRALPAGFSPAAAEAWNALGLPKECDLALAVVPASRAGETDAWYLYSPILRRSAALVGPPRETSRPSWVVATWGFTTADRRAGGSPVVVEVESGSSAASIGLTAGSRIASIGGHAVMRSAEVRSTLAAASVAKPIALEWTDGAGTKKAADLVGRAGPRLLLDRAAPAASAVLAAWASVDAVADAERASHAWANLGLLFLDAGLAAQAEQAWRRVTWGERAGIGEGTRAYYLGVALEAQGKEDEATTLYRQAASTSARAFDDAGPGIAAAARDRLADLGVVVSAR
jgi:tetratricopeptide (TPR) repeat protein